MLQGLQLSALPQVAPYPIRNPPRLRSRLRARESPPPAPSFQVGDRVRVLRGCCQGLESTVTAIQPHLKHSIVLEPGKGRFPPDMLERVTAPPPEPIRFQKDDYVSPQRHHPQDIGIVLSCRVWAKVQWLNRTGCSKEYPSALRLRSADDPEVIAVVHRHQEEMVELEGWTQTLTPTPKAPAPLQPQRQSRGLDRRTPGQQKA
jgi:hypothetical protein